jgi:uncharacterized protein YecT (DUF1311 family)/pimeloyl-ACP methyl ester carboxylesterase
MNFINTKKVLFGLWGGMIASAFLNILPAASQQYKLDCNNPRSLAGVQQQTCARLAYEKADVELNLVWKRVVSGLSGNAKESLIDRQLAWIEKRNSICDDETRVSRGRSGYRVFLNNCLRRVTIERTEVLRGYLPSNNQAQVSTQGLQNLPDGDYAYRQNLNSSSRFDISRYFIFRKAGFSAVGYHFQPRTDWVYCWKGDLQGNSIVNVVNAEPRFGRGVSGYDFVNAKSENLLSYQQVDANSLFVQSSKLRQSFQECITLFSNKTSNAIPSVPSSSTPVRPTDTIAKYPSNDEFKAFDNKFRGNADSLVKLRGNQADQRRKFQNEWKSRNPNAAKFLGAWYTGDRYFYVFPSTAKGGTCVVTQDANGKLDMKIGVALNQELRYDGGKGLFWRDRPNIIASRDSGTGSLYPIYATSGMPELSDSMIGDMERQKCITTLPFEADAQYYKERGDKFAKLGNKDEAISNYRKALELFRKQNQLAQIRTVESLITGLGGTPTNKPITQKPVDAIYSGLSPLYEDVKDPAYGSEIFKSNREVTPTFRVGLNAFDITDNGATVKLNSKVKSNVPTIIITHGWNNNLTSQEFRNLLKAVRYQSSMQVLVVDWSQGSYTSILGLAGARIEVSANKVADLIQKYKLDPNNVHLIGHSLGAHLSVDVALELQKRDLGSVRSITLLDPAVDIGAGGYKVKDLRQVSQSTFIRAFYTSAAGSSSFATSANESYNIKFPSQTVRIIASDAHGEAMTLLANSFQGDSNGNRNCIAEQFTKLDQQFPSIPQNTNRERPSFGTKPSTDLFVAYDSNKWLYPKQIVSGLLDVNPEKGNCKLESDGTRIFDSIQNILK